MDPVVGLCMLVFYIVLYTLAIFLTVFTLDLLWLICGWLMLLVAIPQFIGHQFFEPSKFPANDWFEAWVTTPFFMCFLIISQFTGYKKEYLLEIEKKSNKIMDKIEKMEQNGYVSVSTKVNNIILVVSIILAILLVIAMLLFFFTGLGLEIGAYFISPYWSLYYILYPIGGVLLFLTCCTFLALVLAISFFVVSVLEIVHHSQDLKKIKKGLKDKINNTNEKSEDKENLIKEDK